jgi:uncharacterized membrane protein (DUF2068 family)
MDLPIEKRKHENTGNRKVLRTLAVVEACKGLLVLLVGLGLLTFIYRDTLAEAEYIAQFLNLNSGHHIPKIFIDTLSRIEDPQLLMLSFTAMAYFLIRSVEAAGLWMSRTWAEWLAIVSDSIFIPMEIIELAHGITPVRLLVFFTNIAIVGCLVAVVSARMKRTRDQKPMNA